MSIKLFDLSQKVAAITGSGRGIGRAIARGMAAAGAKVVIADIDAASARVSAAEIEQAGAEALAVEVDTVSPEQCTRMVDSTVERFGRIDVMVCNAAVDVIKPAVELAEAEWDWIVDVDLKGYFNAAQAAARRMLAQGGGSIVMTSSLASVIGIHGLVAYAAAKGGVNQLVRSMAVEWATSNVRVNAIAPGYCENIMVGAESTHADPVKEQQIRTFTPMGRRCKPEELVGPVIFLASEAASYVTGAILHVDGGYTAM
ncbi:SDR family NAD(P)-dependent oxidoreductase [Gloeobacter violaceus]|nr:glucose 1-dehydrogenase [Gloeobacter violaceus]